MSHDCVIIPGFGGFVLQSVPASCSVEEHVFRPMRKDILFNGTLKHQDGLLAESYMKMYDVNYARAVSMVGEDVELLLLRMKAAGQIDLGMIGSLRFGDEGQIVFTSAEDNLLSVDAYGLPSFYFAPLSALRKEQDDVFIPVRKYEEKKRDAVYIRINRSVLRAGAAVAAVAAFVLLVSTPIRDVNPSMYTASFVPSEMTVNIPQPESSAPGLPGDAAVTVAVPVAGEAVAAGAEAQPVVPKTGKTYYIVIGSFPDMESGLKYMGEVDKTQYPNVGTVERGEKVRVYSEKFDNREEAESYLSVIRQSEKHQDAWLFISR